MLMGVRMSKVFKTGLVLLFAPLLAMAEDVDHAATRALRFDASAASVTADLQDGKKAVPKKTKLQAPATFASTAEMRAYWHKQNGAARAAGDPLEWKEIIDQAALALKDDREGREYFENQLWHWTRLAGTPTEILALGEAMLLTIPNDFSHPFELSQEYSRFQQFDRAKAMIDLGLTIAAKRKLSTFTQLSVENAYNSAMRNLAKEQGRLDEAIKAATRSIEIHDFRQNEANVPMDAKRWINSYRIGAVGSRQSLVSLLISAGEIQAAREKLRETEQLSEQFGQKGTRQAELLNLHAHIELVAGNFKKSIEFTRQVEQVFAQLGMSERTLQWVDARKRQVTALVALGRLVEAQAVSASMLDVAGDDAMLRRRGISGIDQTMISWRTGKLADALKRVQSMVMNDRERYGAEYYQTLRSEAVASAISYQITPSPAVLAELGRWCEKLLDNRSGMASSAVEKSYRRFILEAYLQGLAASGQQDAVAIDSGFRIADALRESAVGDVVMGAAVRSASHQPGLRELVARQRSLKLEIDASFNNLAAAQGRGEKDEKVLASLRQALRSQQDEQIQTEKDIARRFPEYNQLTAAEPVRLKDVSRLLGRNEALISILPGETASFVWVITRDRPTQFFTSRLSQNILRDQVGRIRTTLDVGNRPAGLIPEFDQATARLLYDELLAPASKTLAGRSHLIVNAAGPLGQLPFTTLLAGPNNPQGPDWLVRHYAVTHIASMGAFASLRQTGHRAVASKPFIGFGDPVFTSLAEAAPAGRTRNLGMQRIAPQDGLAGAVKSYNLIPPLPETRDELIAMAGALGADPQQDLYLGKAATRQAVLKAPLADYQVISFSTHGLMAGDLPGLTQPALALAASDQAGESSLLTLEDVLGLKLNADWVVLSACNTAAADGEASEALSGLGRGFFYAGARALLVTHWAVESESAKQLVTATFKGYGEDKSLSRAEALRRAQLKLIESKQYAHPFYWAPYALVGDGG